MSVIKKMNNNKICCGPGYASPAEAIKAPNEKLLYTIAIYTGTGIQNLIILQLLMLIQRVQIIQK